MSEEDAREGGDVPAEMMEKDVQESDKKFEKVAGLVQEVERRRRVEGEGREERNLSSTGFELGGLLPSFLSSMDAGQLQLESCDCL